LATAFAGAGGCRTGSDWKFVDFFDLHKGFPWSDDKEKPGVPVRLVGTWSDTVLRKDGQMPQRGFGGRLFFYGKESTDPILVDGQLVVYAFDETGREPTDNRPTRRYVFPPEQIPLHESKTELGTSYSFWLPWDEVGGPQTEVSLICRFEPKRGSVVASEQTRHLLPGALAPGTMQAANGRPKLPEGVPSRPAIRQAQYSAEQSGSGLAQTADNGGQLGGDARPESNRQMTTTSISLPAGFRLGGGVASVRGGPSASGTSSKTTGVAVVERSEPTVERHSGGSPLARPQPPTTSPAAALARPALPFTSSPPQVDPAVPPTALTGLAAQPVPANGASAYQSATTHQTLPPAGGLTTTVSYRFPGQAAPAPSPYPWQASSGWPPQTLPAQAAQDSLAPAALTR
jgi:hypothetical protein